MDGLQPALTDCRRPQCIGWRRDFKALRSLSGGDTRWQEVKRLIHSNSSNRAAD